MEQQFIDALYSQNWYAIVGLAVFGVIYACKKSPFAAAWWYAIPDRMRWLVPIAAGAGGGFTDAFLAGLSWERAVLSAITGALFIGGFAMGVQSAVKESGKPALDTKPGQGDQNGS